MRSQITGLSASDLSCVIFVRPDFGYTSTESGRTYGVTIPLDQIVVFGAGNLCRRLARVMRSEVVFR